MGAPVEETSIAGDRVAHRRAVFSSQRAAIDFLRDVVDQYRAAYAVRARARDIVFRQAQCRPRDQLCHAIAIGRWVQDNVTYVNELPEVFQTPTTTVATGYGDCDDFTVLICSLLESIGIASELVGLEWTEKDERGRPLKMFRHIFPRAIIPGMRAPVPLDATLTTPIEQLTDPVKVARAMGKDAQTYVR